MKRLVLALVLCAGCGHGGTAASKQADAAAPVSALANEPESDPRAAIEADLADCAQGEVLACEHACGLGSEVACSQMGMLYAGNVVHDLSRAGSALGLLDESCAAGNGSACSWAGALLEHGVQGANDAGRPLVIIPEDPKSAIAFYTKGCDMDSGIACNYLAEAVRNDGDIRRFIKLEDRACALNAELCGPIGNRYLDRDVRPKDLTRAAGFYKTGCDGGAGEACEGLAQFTEKGLGGVKKDKRAAKRLYQKACEAAPYLEESCEKAR